MDSDPLDEMMAKAIDKMENMWTEQSRLPIYFNMVTEDVMSLMNYLTFDDALKFFVEVMVLMTRTLQKSKEKRKNMY